MCRALKFRQGSAAIGAVYIEEEYKAYRVFDIGEAEQAAVVESDVKTGDFVARGKKIGRASCMERV